MTEHESESARERESGSGISRRDALKAIGLVPVAGMFGVTTAFNPYSDAPASADEAAAAPAKFFTPHELATVHVLADMIIPRDDRSGSASDAGVPAWMDALFSDPLMDLDYTKLQIRGGLAWMDHEADRRYAKTFIASTPAERSAILDDIAWPAKAKPEHSTGVSFFSRFRDLVATGFWSSRMGVEDLRYIGNVFNPNWQGCPPEALRKIGV